jgi:hypothetical protein
MLQRRLIARMLRCTMFGGFCVAHNLRGCCAAQCLGEDVALLNIRKDVALLNIREDVALTYGWPILMQIQVWGAKFHDKTSPLCVRFTTLAPFCAHV